MVLSWPMLNPRLLALAAVLLVGCDKPEAPAPAPSASAAATSAPAAASTAPAVAAAAVSSAKATVAPPTKDVTVSIKDAAAEPQKTVKAIPGGTLTLFLPDSAGTTWSVETADKALGKPKEEVMPGFGPGTNAHQFQWPLKSPPLKAGDTRKFTFVNKKAKQNFSLTVEIVAPLRRSFARRWLLVTSRSPATWAPASRRWSGGST